MLGRPFFNLEMHGIGTFFDLFDIFLAGVLGAVLTQQFSLDRLSLPAALSSAFIGMFIGAIVLRAPAGQ